MISVIFSENGVELLRLGVAYDQETEIVGDESVVDWNIKLHSVRYGRAISFSEDTEEWARCLPTAYAASSMRVTVVEPERISALEAEIAELHLRLDRLEHATKAAGSAVQTRPVTRPDRPPIADQSLPRPLSTQPRTQPSWSGQPARVSAPAPEPFSIESVATPRNLALVGGGVIAFGLVFLVSYAISHGWISESLRCWLAALVSLGLFVGGYWLRDQHQQGSPAVATSAAGLVGGYATIIATVSAYHLLSTTVGLIVVIMIAAAGSALGARWREQVLMAMAILTSLAVPALLGVSYNVQLLVFLLPLFAVAVILGGWFNWPSIPAAALSILLASLLAIVPHMTPLAVVMVGAFLVGLTGLSLSGPALLGRVPAVAYDGSYVAIIIGAASALVRFAITRAAVSGVVAGNGSHNSGLAWLAFVMAFGAVLALVADRQQQWSLRRVWLLISVGAGAWLIGTGLSNQGLVGAWLGAGVVGLLIARRDEDRWSSVGLFALALGHTLAWEIPLSALAHGVPQLGPALVVGCALVLAGVIVAVQGPERWRAWAALIAGGWLLYFASTMIITHFHTSEQALMSVTAFDPAAQGQVLVSSLWAVTSLSLIVAGLQLRQQSWRSVGLGLLGISLGKIVLVDLAFLPTAGRALSFIVVGSIVLLAAFAYFNWLSPTEQTPTVALGSSPRPETYPPSAPLPTPSEPNTVDSTSGDQTST